MYIVSISQEYSEAVVNWLIESVGLLAGILIYGAAIFNNLIKIKALMTLATVCFLTYALVNILPSMILINSVGLCICIYGLIKAIKLRNANDNKKSAS